MKAPKKNNGHWMPFFVGDYLSDTMHLTTEQHGAYLLLIMAYWVKSKAVPNNDKKLASICKMSEKKWAETRAIISEFFDTDSDPELWVHHRIEKEIEEGEIRRLAAVERGKKGANKRYGKT